MMERLAAAGLVGFTRLLVGARADWRAPPAQGQCLYFANHSSHLDTLAIWSALDPPRRAATRPVAARSTTPTPSPPPACAFASCSRCFPPIANQEPRPSCPVCP